MLLLATPTNEQEDASMERDGSDTLTPLQITAKAVAPTSALHNAVRHALHSRPWRLHAAALVAGFAGVTPLASGATFPHVFPLANLYPANGGDGTLGFVVTGIAALDELGSSLSEAGDVNGDGIDDLIVGAEDADPRAESPGGERGESYVVFGSTAG